MTSAHVLVIDVANVMGSRADGWWRDRAGAARRLAEEVRSRAADEHAVVLVLEGVARRALPESQDDRLSVVHAPADGDDTVVEQARALVEQGREVTVVTADRELRRRVEAQDVTCRGPRWFLDLLA